MNTYLTRKVTEAFRQWDLQYHPEFTEHLKLPKEEACLVHLLHEAGHAKYEGLELGPNLEDRILSHIHPKPTMQQQVSEDYAVTFSRISLFILSWSWLEDFNHLVKDQVLHLDPTRRWGGPDYFQEAAEEFCSRYLAS